MKKKRKERSYKSKSSLRLMAAICICAMLFALGTVTAGAERLEPNLTGEAASEATSVHSRAARKIHYSLPGVSNKSIYAHTRLSTVVNNRSLDEESLVINGIAYIPLESAARALGISDVRYDGASRTMTVRSAGLLLSATDGGFVIYANDRPLFSFSPTVLMSNGRIYVPAAAFAKATGTSFARSSDRLALSGRFKPLAPASSYYREDEIFWLGRIITAEAGGESLLGQIAVGDVILNRVKSTQFPSTIYSVIFDRKYGVQFSPAANGAIYNTPTYTATLAAKICLEGTSLSDNAMYFINPRKAPNSWVSRAREYAYTIGNHDFYL